MDDAGRVGNGLSRPRAIGLNLSTLSAHAAFFLTGQPDSYGCRRRAVHPMEIPMHRVIAVALLLMSAGASNAQTFEKKNFNYSPFAHGAFSEVVTVTGPAKFIYLAGIGSEDEKDGSVRHKDDFLAQCQFAWEKVGKLLKEH